MRNLHVEVNDFSLAEDSLFIAIVGERYNPLKNLDKVIAANCQYLVYEQSEESDILISKFSDQINFLPVIDIVEFIGLLAKAVVSEFHEREGKVVAISGSNGKTTTKEMLFHLLNNNSEQGEVICTQKNNNNHLGVPFTLFQIRENTKTAIVELGSNSIGEIEHLCKMINADIGVTTNIGDTHLEFFGTRENVFTEESILYHYCQDIFLINYDDPFLSKLEIAVNKKTFGEKSKENTFKFIKGGVSVSGNKLLNEYITGKHNFQNLGLAFCLAMNLSPSNKKKFIELAASFKPTENRSQWIEYADCHIFLDAYNANPSSMRAALAGFSEYIQAKGSSNNEACVIMGDMNELGAESNAAHAETGEYALNLEFGEYIFVGHFRDEYTNNSNKNIHKFASTQEAKFRFKDLSKHYKYLFIKGSRSLQLERITDIK